MKLGKANYSGNQKEIFKIKDGDNIFRILPPMGDLAEKGVWRKYYSVVWGYKDTSGKNRPFQDCRVKNYKTQMVEVESDAYLKSQELRAENDELRKQIKEMAKSGQEVTPAMFERAKELKELTMKYNIENKHHMNVMSIDGKIGLLKLGSRGMNALRAEIDKLTEKGVDPLSVENGRFFNIHRSGTGLDTVYGVSVYKENVEVNGEIYQKDKAHELTQTIIDRLENEAFELDKIYPSPSAEEVSRIVNGTAVDVDAVLGSSESSQESSQTAAKQQVSSSTQQPTGGVEAQQPVQPATQVEAKQVSEPVQTQANELRKQSEAAAPVSSSSNAASQSEEDFLAEIMKGVS